MIRFLNKIHYGLFHFQLAVDSKLNSILLKITPKKKERVVQAKISETESFMKSFHMGLVNHCFGYCYAGYFSFFSFSSVSSFVPSISSTSSAYFSFFSLILLGVMKIYFHIEVTTLELVIFAIPIVIGYIPMYKVVFVNDRYLCFYKEFKKKNVQWHKKWKRIAMLFCVGGFLTMVIGAFILLNLLANNIR